MKPISEALYLKYINVTIPRHENMPKSPRPSHHITSDFFQNQFQKISMEVASDNFFSHNYLLFLSYHIFILDPFHFRNALGNVLSDAFLIITEVLLMTCS